MKFLAILRDSLREAIDAKVFYVMVALSLLLIGLAGTCTFKPRPGGEMLMQAASVPLAVDLSDLDLANPDPETLVRRFTMRTGGGMYHMVKAEPMPGQPDEPSSTFRVSIQARFNPLGGASTPAPEDYIRTHFGVLDKWRLADVIDVRRVDKPLLGPFHNPLAAEFEVEARVTPQGRRLWPYDFSLFFGAVPIVREGVPLGAQLFLLENYIVNGIGAWITILVSVVITAFFIPNMLRKGTIDMLLVKPISRTTLLLYKYVGGLLFIFLNTALAVGGVYLALGIRSGIWAPAFLLSIFIITFFFAILYSVSTLFAVLTRSPIVAILLTCAVWFGLFIVGILNGFFEGERKRDTQAKLRHGTPVCVSLVGLAVSPAGHGPLLATAAVQPFSPGAEALSRPVFHDNWFARAVNAVHYVLPRTRNLDDLTTLLLLRDLVFSNQVGTQRLTPTPITWRESLTVSGLFIAVMLGLSCWRFATRDY